MNIVYSSDNNYARHAGISITSLYENHKELPELNVYLINNGITSENIHKLNNIAKSYNRQITYIDFSKYIPFLESKLHNDSWELPISTYARLFVSEMMPESVEKLIYLDCDIIINDTLVPMWETEMDNHTVGGTEDVCSCIFWNETDVEEQFRYICAGVLLINLKKWRKENTTQRVMEYIEKKSGVLAHHDQTVINGLFNKELLILPAQYNVETPEFIMSYSNLKAFFKLNDNYYTKDEINRAVKKPAIIHYTSSNVGRPWENKAHPKGDIYRKYWKNSPWKDEPWGVFNSTYDKTTKRVYWMYQHIPVKLIKLLSK